MAKDTTILKMTHGHKFSVVYRAGDQNPYRLYRHTWGLNKNGYCSEHKRLEVKYADFKSCLYYILNCY